MEKVKFLSKAERAKLAIERREQQVAEEKSLIQSYFSESTSSSSRNPSNPSRDHDGDHGKSHTFRENRGQKHGRDERHSRDSLDYDGESRQKKDIQDMRTPKDDIVLEDGERELIRNQHLGLDTRQKKPKRDKKFLFDWKAGEDTSMDINPLYRKKHSAQLFGRGLIGGIDVRAQQKSRSEFYERARDKLTKDLMEEEKSDDRHWSEKPLEAMKERDWRIFREDFTIYVKGGPVPVPLRSWSDAKLPQKIHDVIRQIGYRDPTPIQRQAIPINLVNRDLIGIAETGSGKTASFVIPMLSYISEMPPLTQLNKDQGPYAVILAPTRELAIQIDTETRKFADALGYTCVAIVGGRSIEEQGVSLRNGAHIIIATPGRLVDLLDRRILALAQCSYVVLDEADRMVDLGFEMDLKIILDSMPVSNQKPDSDDQDIQNLKSLTGKDTRFRQTVMFSATMPPAVERFARTYLRRPATVTIGVAGQVVERIEQRVEFTHDEKRKYSRLSSILSSGEFEPPMIIFVNLKKECDQIAKACQSLGYRTSVLHGGKTQDQREAALNSLKDGHADMLIATDVAGRGIDVKNVSVVINFDMAKTIEAYTHRIGRTGRAGEKGVSISFLTNDDADVLYDLKVLMSKSPVSVIPVELARHEAAQTKPGTIRSKQGTIFKE